MRHVKTTFDLRWERYGADLITALESVYGERAWEVTDRVRELVRAKFDQRSDELRELDEARLLRPDWLQLPSQVGYVAYTERFAGTLAGITGHVDYLQDLGVTYLHLMPLLQPREGANDGGYAVADYRTVRPDLGTMADLEALTGQLRGHGISLVVDLVLNHVAREHEWAVRARAGEQKYRDYFMVFPDREMPEQYEATLPEVFPDFAPGNFTWDDDLDGWVWTTFNDYQWDVNWANPDVFVEYLDLILDLANLGVEVFRLDAIAFIWKEMGTDCQNEPPVHAITQALRQAARIAAPAVAFKAEAIVGPKDLIAYFGTGEHHGKLSDIAYHNSLMAQLWSTLATHDTTLLRRALGAFPPKPATATWGTYVRCHDDIGWAIDDVDAATAGLNGAAHRRFLSDFYSGEHPGSFARGLVFQANPATGDRRISGSLASLAGLEAALKAGRPYDVELAVARINLLHAVIAGWGGIPLIYMGDELAMLNDHDFARDPAHAEDNRWVHRPVMDWAAVAALGENPSSPAARVNAWLRHVLAVRRATPHLHASREAEFLETGDPRVLAVRRDHPLGPMVQVYNFSPTEVTVPMGCLAETLGETGHELLDDVEWDLTPWVMTLRPYAVHWFTA
ncbi:alpha-amylase [Tessaracoccus lapidicaptus]|uniref:Alpha-amylase n=1 Tax=Tessaracoccus lapidicaptus TaxID=1427523 RepID=A0A1C0AHM3_9ACTN|nr:alpha-amylase [Tessaracoccus lapidicaptus]